MKWCHPVFPKASVREAIRKMCLKQNTPRRHLPKAIPQKTIQPQQIKPGSDLLFSVPINHLGPTWHLEVTFGLDVPGSGYTIGPHNTVSFFWKDLPEKYRKITNEHNPDR